MTHNLFWVWEECTKFHEKSANFCTLWEKSYCENQSNLPHPAKHTKLLLATVFILIKAVFLKLSPLKSWADYSQPPNSCPASTDIFLFFITLSRYCRSFLVMFGLNWDSLSGEAFYMWSSNNVIFKVKCAITGYRVFQKSEKMKSLC